MAFSMHVNMNRCTGCGNCVVSCPVNALELYTLDPVTKEKIYRVVNGKSISLDVNMEYIQKGEIENTAAYIAWLLRATKGYGFKIVNPGGTAAWHKPNPSVSSPD